MPVKFDVESYLTRERELKQRWKEEQARTKQSLVISERTALKELEAYLGKEIPAKFQRDFENGETGDLKVCIQKGHVTYLFISFQKLESLPDVIGAFPKLRKLNLQENHLTMLPESIGTLRSLITLKIDSNLFTTLPDWIGNMSSLRFFYAMWCRLVSIPATIGNLINLETLAVGGNRLASLPDSIGNLTKLTILQLYHNQLTTLPASITHLQSLEFFDLGENPLSDLPSPVVQWINDVNMKIDERIKQNNI